MARFPETDRRPTSICEEDLLALLLLGSEILGRERRETYQLLSRCLNDQ